VSRKERCTQYALGMRISGMRRVVLVCGMGCLSCAAMVAQKGLAKKKSAAEDAPAVVVQPTVETLDLDMYSRIRDEGFNRSHVMQYASALFDDIGERLTGSPAMTRANEWTRAQLAAMGCENAHLESWGEFGMAWTQEGAGLELVKPDPAVFLAQASPWSPSTPGEVTAEVISVPGMKEESEFAQWKGKLKGKVILYGQGAENPEVDPDKVPAMEHYDAAKLAEQAQYPLKGDLIGDFGCF
jgi:carboxypeptidase Q